MKRGASWVAACAVVFAAFSSAAAAGETWEPAKTWVFAVGIVHWKHKHEFDSFSKKERLEPKLLEAFKKRGVPAGHITYLEDEKATEANIKSSLHDLLLKTRGDDLLVVYFQGHGYWDVKTGEHFFACYDCDDHHTWSVRSIFDSIEHDFRGQRAWLMADCCGSGGLVSAAKKYSAGRVSFACLGSSFMNNGSTGAWTFTASLIRGLSGDAVVDLNGDGAIELQEFARYVEREMAFIEEQKSVFGVTGQFDSHLVLEKSRSSHDPEIGRHVEAKWDDGKWWKAEVEGKKEGKTRVRYADDNSVRWVPDGEVRAFHPREFAVGTKVMARPDDDEDKHWYAATVVHAYLGLHEVHFDDARKHADEWVSPDRIKGR